MARGKHPQVWRAVTRGQRRQWSSQPLPRLSLEVIRMGASLLLQTSGMVCGLCPRVLSGGLWDTEKGTLWKIMIRQSGNSLMFFQLGVHPKN